MLILLSFNIKSIPFVEVQLYIVSASVKVYIKHIRFLFEEIIHFWFTLSTHSVGEDFTDSGI